MANALIRFDRLKAAIEKSKSVDEAKGIKDKAEAARIYAKKIGLSLGVQNECAEIKLRAERKAGELLAGMDLRKNAGRPKKNRSDDEKNSRPTLADLGVKDARLSSRWQLESIVPEREFLAFLKTCRDEDEEITSSGLLEIAKSIKAAREKKERAEKTDDIEGKIHDLDSAAGLYRCIYADPPWQYGDAGCEGAAEHEYATMPIDEIKALNVAGLAHEEGAHLWMWTTWPMIRDRAPHEVLDAWGFRWVGEIAWVKPGLGVGRWLRPSTEILILAVKGDLKLLRQDQKGHLEAPRGRHSEKPKEFRQLVETLTPGPRIELFARDGFEGWSRWGNEA